MHLATDEEDSYVRELAEYVGLMILHGPEDAEVDLSPVPCLNVVFLSKVINNHS